MAKVFIVGEQRRESGELVERGVSGDKVRAENSHSARLTSDVSDELQLSLASKTQNSGQDMITGKYNTSV